MCAAFQQGGWKNPAAGKCALNNNIPRQKIPAGDVFWKGAPKGEGKGITP